MKRLPAFLLAGLIAIGAPALYASFFIWPEIMAPLLIAVCIAAIWGGIYSTFREDA